MHGPLHGAIETATLFHTFCYPQAFMLSIVVGTYATLLSNFLIRYSRSSTGSTVQAA